VITLRQLRYLSALAEHRHFGRAAEACAVSQPALSMQIRDMENTLSAQLVERRPGEIVLTDIGQQVVAKGDQILASVRDIEDYARHGSAVLSGPLTLGVIPTLAPYVLPRVLPKLQERYPALQVELRETQTRVLVDELARGDLDVIMLALPVTEADVETKPLFDDPFLLAVPAGDPRSNNRRITPSDIDQDRLILLEEGHCLRDQALAFCAGSRRGGSMGLGATSLATVIQMVANGYGVTLLPQVAADVEARDERVKLLRFVPPQPGRTIGLAWRRTSPRKVDFIALGQIATEAVGAV
jgi:LysR family hydrogen peroxide-inducible transcriptional activator